MPALDLSEHCERMITQQNEIKLLALFTKNRRQVHSLARSNIGIDVLGVAACLGSVALVRRLVSLGAPLNVAVPSIGWSPLHCAANEGYVECMEVLLEGGASVNLRTMQGYSALHSASFSGRLEAVELLLKHGASIDIRDKSNETPALLAALKGHADVLRLLLGTGASLYAVDTSGRGLLSHAVIYPRVDVLRVIVSHAPKYLRNKKFLAEMVTIALQNDCDLPFVQVLVDLGADERFPVCLDRGDIMLHQVARYGRCDLLSVFPSAREGSLLDILNFEGATPLFVAVGGGRRKTAVKLTRLGSDIDRFSAEGLTALACAVRKGNVEIACKLLALGAIVDPREPAQKFTVSPLVFAASQNNMELVQLLLKNGADVESPFACTRPFSEAASCGHLDIMRYLVEQGADPFARNSNGGNALIAVARSYGEPGHNSSPELLECLINEYKLDVNSRKNSTKTALHIAARYGLVEVGHILIKNGADVNARVESGKS